MSYAEDHLLDDLKRIVADVSSSPPQITHGKLFACIEEIERLRNEVAEWHSETARFNRGFARRAEPYENLEDEFEQMGHAWGNYDANHRLREENERLRAWLVRGVKDAYDSGGSIESPALTGLECQHALDGKDSAR